MSDMLDVAVVLRRCTRLILRTFPDAEPWGPIGVERDSEIWKLWKFPDLKSFKTVGFERLYVCMEMSLGIDIHHRVM